MTIFFEPADVVELLEETYVLKCMECFEILAELCRPIENINCLCNKCLSVYEKAESRMVNLNIEHRRIINMLKEK